MRDTFVRTLLELARTDDRIELMTGDLGFGVLKPFWETLPDQFTNCGIAEQNMVSAAAGMALSGKIVFVYSIGNFPTLRCLEHVRNDCAHHHANVKIICVGEGFSYGTLGMSHAATEDISVMRALPDVAVFSPGDAAEAEAVTRAMVDYQGTCYLRLSRGGDMAIPHEEAFVIGKAMKVKDGSRAVIFSTGSIYEEVDRAVKQLKEAGIDPAVYTFPTIKPLDVDQIRECTKQFEVIVTVEEHNLSGGFGSAVAEVMAENPAKARLLRVGLDDIYVNVAGSTAYLRKRFGICAEAIADRIKASLNG